MATVNGKLVVTKNLSGCLSLYPMQVWEPYEATLLALPAENEDWRRFFLGDAEDVEIDSASRVLIPPELRSWAGLEREVKFMGMGTYFELWDKARHAAAEVETRAKGLPPTLSNLVIR
jgi:MraZ protein